MSGAGLRLALAADLRGAGDVEGALAVIEALPATDRESLATRTLEAALLGELGRHEAQAALYRALSDAHPHEPGLWVNLALVLGTLGRRDEAVAAFRRALAIDPGLGEAWWGLANLKTFRFAPVDLAAMRRGLRCSLAPRHVAAIHFALGKALADRGDHADAFGQYDQGNRAIAATLDPGRASVTRRVDQLIGHFDAALFDRHCAQGHPSEAPIFIIGMHRAGSTLAEQILASHSAVEGTAELPVLPGLWRSLGPDPLAAIETADLAALGAEYLTRTRAYRREGRLRFIDKQPDNWLHVGFIRLILPNATIIDARRHPMATGFSIYRQLFAAGAAFAYDLVTIGHFYADYVRLMAHYDRIQPDAVHRLAYERLVDDPEAQIRDLLDAAHLPFEEACLNFHANPRAVATPSAQQVRRPINRDGLDSWRPFEPWLGPLREALGDTLESWDLPA